jgi:hypothetical protein
MMRYWMRLRERSGSRDVARYVSTKNLRILDCLNFLLNYCLTPAFLM